jgi:DNA ligase 1
MKRFAALYTALDETTRTSVKVAALADYFRTAPPADAVWAVRFLSGRRPKRVVTTTRLRLWAAEAAGIPDWLFDECYASVGDLAETIALVLPEASGGSDVPFHRWVEERLLPLRGMEEEVQRDAMLAAWSELGSGERFVWNKLITGSFRVGVSQRLVVRGLADASGVEEGPIAHRLMGHWEPTPEFYARLLSPDTTDAEISRPYPFYLAYPLEEDPAALGEPERWLAEWKWDGIRAQLVRRAGRTFLWSRGEELVTDRYPELDEASALLPDGTVIDGEIMPWRDGQPLPFGELQRRIGRKTVGRKLLAEVPVVLLGYDLLERGGEDIRERPLRERREMLARVVEASGSSGRFLLSPTVPFGGWDELAKQKAESRDRRVEGLMLKDLESPYRVGRRRGEWWKWKVAPFTADAVLLYAQRGSGRRASLYTDYTFGVWDGDELVPFAKAYSGLTDAEIRRVDRWVRRNTVEKYGPVRAVTPELVFELAFEGIRRSTRHKSGVAVRFPRMHRWREDKPAAEADTIDTVRALLPEHERAG